MAWEQSARDPSVPGQCATRRGIPASAAPARTRSRRLEADAGIGRGVREIRIHSDGEHRVFYLASFAEAIYILHAFEKRTQKTPHRELELARARFRVLLSIRRQTGNEKEN